MPTIWWMPIQTRTEMLSTGIRSPLGIKVFGPDAASDRARGRRDRARAGRRPGHAQRLRRAAHRRLLPRLPRRPRGRRAPRPARARRERGGRVRDRRHGDRRRPSRAASATRSACATRATSARTPTRSGACWSRRPPARRCRSRRWRELEFRMGPPMVRSETGQLLGLVFVDVADRPVVDYVAEARRAVAGDVALPAGVRLEWAGQYRALRAREAAAQRGDPRDPRADRAAPVSQHRLRGRDGDRPAGGAVLADRRLLAALAARLQPERRGVGRASSRWPGSTPRPGS